jgi:RNA polymerase sigma factor FliA
VNIPKSSGKKESSMKPKSGRTPQFHGAAKIEPTATEEDERKFQRLVEDYFPLVRSIVDRMKQKLPNTIEADELHSVGVSGLVAAAKRYQPSQQKSFAGYAATRIRGAILDELRRQDWMSRSSRAKAKRLGSAISKLQQERGANYGRDSLCIELNMSEEELTRLMDEVRPVRLVSLDGVDTQDDCIHDSLHSIIPDDCCVSTLDALERKEILSLLADRMAQLPERQKKVLAMYYYENMQLSKIAAIFRVTESRICQIRGQAVGTLRNHLTRLLA